MNTSFKLSSTLLSFLLLSGCASTFKASYDHDQENDFSGYKTFSWISKNPMTLGEGSRTPSPLLEPRISSAIENALTESGYSYVIQPENADFVVAFTVGSREGVTIKSYPTMSMSYGRAYPGRAGWGTAYYAGGSETRVSEYTEGMLAIDIFDVAARRPVWHGVATKNITKSDRDEMEATVKAAVDAILAGFPPK